MPKYLTLKVAGYFLYFTFTCIIEAFHVHASDTRLSERGLAKLFMREDGSTELMEQGRFSDREVRIRNLDTPHFIRPSNADEGITVACGGSASAVPMHIASALRVQ